MTASDTGKAMNNMDSNITAELSERDCFAFIKVKSDQNVYKPYVMVANVATKET